jgi:hypothetical protein
MGHWGVKSYENDDAADALDAGIDRVHGALYESLMDDKSPLSFEQVQARFASSETLAAALDALAQTVGLPPDAWDETARLAFAGVVVRHAELGVDIPDQVRALAIDWLENEQIDWQAATPRQRCRIREIALLRKSDSA